MVKARARIAVPALVMGPAKGARDEDGDIPDDETGEGVPPAFEEAAGRAFPELAESPDRMLALFEAMRAVLDEGGA
jgi:hypothetical protein